MSHENPVPVPWRRLTFVILGVLLLVVILVLAFYYLQREGKTRSNPTDGHTELVLPGGDGVS